MMFGGQSRKSSFFTSRWSDRDTEEYRKGYPVSTECCEHVEPLAERMCKHGDVEPLVE